MFSAKDSSRLLRPGEEEELRLSLIEDAVGDLKHKHPRGASEKNPEPDSQQLREARRHWLD